MSATVDELSNKAFDYVVVGGGTAGLTVAARLAENPSISVAVLEAGSANIGDPMIDIPAQFGRHFGNPQYDWDFKTSPQKSADDAVYSWARGKTLGGSSAINFYAWSKPQASDIDAWEQLGNPGWNSSRYFEYSKKVECFIPPRDEALARECQQVVKPDVHGHSGPLKTSFPNLVTAAELPFQEAMSKAGIPVAKNPLGGDPVGRTVCPNTLDPATNKRSTAATAFYLPNKDKKNFRVLCNALVLKLIIEDRDGGVIAHGVEFEHQGKVYTLNAKKEVILSAGALKTPQILELSGIGGRSVLEPLGIKTIVDLPGVGENIQEHNFAMLIYELDPKNEIVSLDSLFNPVFAAAQLALHPEGKGMYCIGLGSFAFVPLSTIMGSDRARALIERQKEKIQARIDKGSLSKSLEAQYKIQLQKMETGRNGECELILYPGSFLPSFVKAGKDHVTALAATNLPFSRGTIHIGSTNPHDQPIMDPHSFEDTFDLDLHTETLKFHRKLAEIEPWKSMLAEEVFPGPACSTDEDFHAIIKKFLGSTFHTAGSASMLPRELDGVVDPQLLVYGTQNIRVVDLSIIPLHVAAHTQATAYTIGEIAADIIKGAL